MPDAMREPSSIQEQEQDLTPLPPLGLGLPHDPSKRIYPGRQIPRRAAAGR